MNSILEFFTVTFIPVFAENKKNLQMDLVVSDQQLIMLFTIFILAIIGIFIYIARDAILRKKTSYDTKDFESKKDKSYEKYHSDWQDDYEEFGKRSHVKGEEYFKEALEDASLPDYYSILGISKAESQDGIKKRFRELVKEMHPDRTKDPESEKKMAQINRAYEVLSDSKLREKYDKYIE